LSAKAEPSLEELLSRYRLFLRNEQVAQCFKYIALLQKWNRRMNLTASADWIELYPFFEEAIWASTFYPEGPVRHLDVGSGAGFPALIIRIVKSGMLLDLLERRGKRAVFLQTAIRELGLGGAIIHNQDLDSFLKVRPRDGVWDIVSSKGVRWKRGEFARLGGRTRELWIFHGRDFPESLGLDQFLLLRRAECPCRPSWYLSIFQRSNA
jgi:16S rRNA G527 N7-methylase RsmG